MHSSQNVALSVAIGIVAICVSTLSWYFPNIGLNWKLTITGIGVFIVLLVFWRRFRVIFQRYWQEVLCFLLLGVVIWFFSIKFGTFLFPSILIIFVSVAIAMLLCTKYISPKYRKHDKTLVFDDDFHNPEYWSLNHWGSNCSSISGKQMRFTGSTAPKGEDGSHRDLTNILEVGQIYRIICHVKAEPGTTAQFRLWCHDNIRPNVPKGTDVSTGFKTPLPHGESVSVIYNPYYNPHIRIHLQYKPGKGTIFVDSVRLYKIL